MGLAIILPFASCSKDNPVTEDTQEPVITWLSPADGSVFSSGDDILVSFRIEENDELHTWDLELRKSSNDSLLLNVGEHDHAQVLNISQTITATVGGATPCTLIVIAEDHAGNEAIVQRSLTINP